MSPSADEPIVCPNCRERLAEPKPLCPACFYPLMFHRPEVETDDADVRSHKPTVAPPEPDPTLIGTDPPARQPHPPPAPQSWTVCPACRQFNDPTRVRCAWCAVELREPEVVSVPTTVEEPTRRRLRPGVVFAVALVTVALVAGIFAYQLSRPAQTPEQPTVDAAQPPEPTASSGPEQTPLGPLTVVDRSQIRAEASSTLPPDGPAQYGAELAVDDNIRTAWNSDGEVAGNGPGITVTFRFEEPQRIGEIRMRNGYQRSAETYARNGRIKVVEVIGDNGSVTWTLPDARRVQSLTHDLGTTAQVVLQIADVYPGNRYPDLAITQITFLASP